MKKFPAEEIGPHIHDFRAVILVGTIAIKKDLAIRLGIGVIEGGPVGEDHSETEVEHIGLLGQSFPPPRFCPDGTGADWQKWS